MKITFASTLLWFSCCLMAPVAHAEKADRYKNMFIQAEDFRIDELNQVTVFFGPVVLTKGTVVMRGARLELREDPQGNQFGTLTAEPGKKAFFRQKREGVDEFIETEAQTIEYDTKADTVKFVQGVELRRYQGATLSSQLTAELIVYDDKTEVFTGSGKKPGADPASGGRVRIMLTPKNAASAPVGDASSTPALRPSTSLSGDKK
jgi:lipopolysaccharide export system protein LptA